MDPRFSTDTSDYRGIVRKFLSDNLPADWAGVGSLDQEKGAEFVTKWRRTMYENGFLGIMWPKEYGGQSRSKLDQVILVQEFANAGVPFGGPNDNFSIKMLGNTLLKFGTEEQKKHFIPRLLSGDDIWCQGYSEPNAGSDLAGISTSAVRDGDEWVINGQKIWTTNAHLANWIFVLARTDTSAPRHKGMTFFMVPLDQPGIEIRPIKMMSGDSEFNETFFTNARTSSANIIGEVNGGWTVAMSLLSHERGEEAATNPVMFRKEFDRLLKLAQDKGATNDPVIRSRLANCYIRVEIMRYVGNRILTGYLRDGVLGAEASTSKLYWSEYHKEVAALAAQILGADGMVVEGRMPPRCWRTDDPGAPNSTGSWIGITYNATAGTIYAGTSQVQRNILGETVLGLPKEPSVNK